MLSFQECLTCLTTLTSSAPKGVLIPKLTLQPLVENAIEHGFEGKGRLMINIGAECEETLVYLLVSDNGKGMGEEKRKELELELERGEVYRQASGIGVVNVNERLKKKFGEEYGIQIKSGKKGGTTVILKVPKEEREG